MAILIGLAKLLSSVGYLLLPATQRQTAVGPVFLPSYAASPGLINAIFWSEALVGIFGRVVVPALASLVHQRNEGWTRWASTLALAGFVIASVGYMASHPQVEDCLVAELSNILGGRIPTEDDLSRLSYAERIVKEALRLFPPAWGLSRLALQDCEIGGYPVPSHASVVVRQWVVQRDPCFSPGRKNFSLSVGQR